MSLLHLCQHCAPVGPGHGIPGVRGRPGAGLLSSTTHRQDIGRRSGDSGQGFEPGVVECSRGSDWISRRGRPCRPAGTEAQSGVGRRTRLRQSAGRGSHVVRCGLFGAGDEEDEGECCHPVRRSTDVGPRSCQRGTIGRCGPKPAPGRILPRAAGGERDWGHDGLLDPSRAELPVADCQGGGTAAGRSSPTRRPRRSRSSWAISKRQPIWR